MSARLLDYWPLFLTLLHVGAASAVTVDAVLRKRHVPSVIGWVGLVWLAPLTGSVIYVLFGINRIQRTAVSQALKERSEAGRERAAADDFVVRVEALSGAPSAFSGVARVGERITGQPLSGGNQVTPLVDGDEAYPAMLSAIDGAVRSVVLLTYIFDNDRVGRLFLKALARARDRGVEVRVLVDDIGARYSRPTMLRLLHAVGVPSASFLPTSVPRLFRYANLRNHRKILVVDGAVGFTGGMNLREDHWLAQGPTHPARCLHFRVEGPVVADLRRTFAIDWAFATGEQLEGERWFPPVSPAGSVIARGVADGPDADLDNMPLLILGALSAATRRVRVVTPYFLPDGVLLRALQVTAMRGVEVDILLPERSNVPLVDWARVPLLSALIARGCRVHLSPPPFDHSKLLVVDGVWSLVGSTNWDARSLRLNFEYNLECYDVQLAARLDALVDARIRSARLLRESELRALRLGVRLRNGLARLLTPYL